MSAIYHDQVVADANIATSDSEAYAVGTRDGVNVVSTDKAYNNNSKYYSNEARKSASSAHQYSVSAAASVSDAQGKVDEASGYAAHAEEQVAVAAAEAAKATEQAERADNASLSAVTNATDAQNYATSASSFSELSQSNAVLSESYTHGSTGTREGEDTDNAKFYMEQAKAQSGTIPTKVSELTNDEGFITNEVNELTNYNTKTEIANTLNNYQTKIGDGSQQIETFIQAASDENIVSGEKHSTIFGKIAKLIDSCISHFSATATSTSKGHVIVDENFSATSTNPIQNKYVYEQIENLKVIATAEQNGMMSFVDKEKLDGISSGATKVEESSTNGNININGTEKLYTLFQLMWQKQQICIVTLTKPHWIS